LLVAVTQRKRLRRLYETARTLGVFLNIHVIPSACRNHPSGVAMASSLGFRGSH
jgi:hypothetical protein